MKKVLLKGFINIFVMAKLGRLMEKILEEERRRRCRSVSSLAVGASFGAEAIVHNRSGDKSRVVIGQNTIVDGELLVHDYGGQINIGANTYVGKGSRIWSGEDVRVGNNVFIAHNVCVTDSNSHQISANKRAEHFLRTCVNGGPFEKDGVITAPVSIGNNAWINFNVGILRGVSVGEGAIVGAGTLVTKDVEPYTLVAGNPMKVIRKIQER